MNNIVEEIIEICRKIVCVNVIRVGNYALLLLEVMK